MYLKSIELVGFKSFATRTTLEFDKGMSAIVGPNGCGKSNVSDAIRWVLGEQSAKALRGSKMEDCIFNGTDKHKPLGLAEVSLTLADCEDRLGTDYNEVRITRRVLRSGEGHYFINKTACRLKDIQRLFMDTGIGTNSYSLMEQGRIDLILSSRPEDRRAVFEEASGITKFKADKKEALRKLDHTEANLLRLADIIREVRRQIISLQRQAGKARRYQELHERQRQLDLHFTRNRLAAFDENIQLLESKLASLREQDEALRTDLQDTEQEATTCRDDLAELEGRIESAMDSAGKARSELDRAQDLIAVNGERIQELQHLSERDNKDADEAQRLLDEHRATLTENAKRLEQATASRGDADKVLTDLTEAFRGYETQTHETSETLERLRGEAVDIESQLAKLQNELSDLEGSQRSTVFRRERLAAEQAEMQRTLDVFQDREERTGDELNGLRGGVKECETRLAGLDKDETELRKETATIQQDLSQLHTQAAALQAKIEVLTDAPTQQDGFPGGARWLLNPQTTLPTDRSAVIGALAELILAKPPYQQALEAALRAWLDAVVVSDTGSAHKILQALESAEQGALRLLSVHAPATPSPAAVDAPGRPLLEQVHCADSIQPLAERLLGNVRVVEGAGDVPESVAEGLTYVTISGVIVRGDGSAEFWSREPQDGNPLSRRHARTRHENAHDDLQKKIATRRQDLEESRAREAELNTGVRAAREDLERSRHNLDLLEGEYKIVSQEAQQARERSETVTYELQVLNEQDDTGQDRRTSIQNEIERLREQQGGTRAAITTHMETYRHLEKQRAEAVAAVADQRVECGERRQAFEELTRRRDFELARIEEMERLTEDRRRGANTHQSRIEVVQTAIEEARSRLEPLEGEVREAQVRLETARAQRDERIARLATLNEALQKKRDITEEVRSHRTRLDIELAEEKMRRQTLTERVTSEYRISPEQVLEEPAPEWEDGVEPDHETLETTIAEIRAKLESMGAVNLVAIDEHKELEDRYAFLTQQQDDLLKAKQQLLDMIRKINRTTTEMFSQTFDQVNASFQDMFKRLFGGGSAKLVLLDEEDVLESGIEIIARPPGKKLQTVSLLSGGERTMTAVALLFSLYLVKPSPFCVLDELDAALDDANIGRFVHLLGDFLTRSQFVVITHNRQTIAAADLLYGVTMDDGVSRIMSVKFADHEKSDAPAEDEPVPAAT